MSCKFVYGSGWGGFRVGGSVLGVFFLESVFLLCLIMKSSTSEEHCLGRSF